MAWTDPKTNYATRLDIRNNVVYNWNNRAIDGGAHEVNFVANYYQPGPATKHFPALNAQYGGFPGSRRYYFADNVMAGHFGLANQMEGRTATTERGGNLPTEYSPWVEKPFFEAHVNTQTAATAYTNVLANVGCNFPALDEHDHCIIAEILTGIFKFEGGKTGLSGLSELQDDVGGWEKQFGLNAADATDGNEDLNSDGYTNLGKYLNSLIGGYQMPVKK